MLKTVCLRMSGRRNTHSSHSKEAQGQCAYFAMKQSKETKTSIMQFHYDTKQTHFEQNTHKFHRIKRLGIVWMSLRRMSVYRR